MRTLVRAGAKSPARGNAERLPLCLPRRLRFLRGRAASLLALAVLASGCAARPPAPEPASMVEPPPPRPVIPAVPPAVSRALKRDTAAVQQHARQYVARPSTPSEAVAKLEPLTRSVNRALAIMELHRRRDGSYRPADVRAARAAADGVAKFLDSQPPPREATE